MTNPAEALAYYVEQERQRILNMEAGLELNVLVSEQVFGWERIDRDGLPPYWLTDERHAGLPANSYSIPPYSTDAGAALQIVAAWPGDFNARRQNGLWFVEFFEPSREYRECAETLPLAICRARLMATL